MINAQAEFIDSAPPVIETGTTPHDQDRVSLTDPDIAAGLVSDLRQDVIIHSALENLIESSFQHGPTAATAHHAAAIALQRVKFHAIRSMPTVMMQEVPADISPDVDNSKVIFFYCERSTEEMRAIIAKEKARSAMLLTGEQDVLANNTPGPANNDAKDWLALRNDTSHLSPMQKVLRQVARRFKKPERPMTINERLNKYYNEALQMREERRVYIATEDQDSLPRYTHEELDVVYQALAGLLNSNLDERFELLAPDKDKKPAMTAYEKTEINAVMTLMNNHKMGEITSIQELVGQRGRTGAYKAVVSGKMTHLKLTTAANESITLPLIDSTVVRHWV